MSDENRYTETESKVKRQELRKLVQAVTRASIALAKALFDVYYGVETQKGGETIKLVHAWGFENFDEYAEHELGMHQTTARSYVRTWDELFLRRGLPEAILPDSFTKLRRLAKISRKPGTTERDLKLWVAKSREMSCCDFDSAIEEALGGRPRTKPIAIAMKWSKAGPVMRALLAAQKRLGVASRGEALTVIVDDWTERNSTSGPGSKRKTGRAA